MFNGKDPKNYYKSKPRYEHQDYSQSETSLGWSSWEDAGIPKNKKHVTFDQEYDYTSHDSLYDGRNMNVYSYLSNYDSSNIYETGNDIFEYDSEDSRYTHYYQPPQHIMYTETDSAFTLRDLSDLENESFGHQLKQRRNYTENFKKKDNIQTEMSETEASFFGRDLNVYFARQPPGYHSFKYKKPTIHRVTSQSESEFQERSVTETEVESEYPSDTKGKQPDYQIYTTKIPENQTNGAFKKELQKNSHEKILSVTNYENIPLLAFKPKNMNVSSQKSMSQVVLLPVIVMKNGEEFDTSKTQLHPQLLPCKDCGMAEKSGDGIKVYTAVNTAQNNMFGKTNDKNPHIYSCFKTENNEPGKNLGPKSVNYKSISKTVSNEKKPSYVYLPSILRMPGAKRSKSPKENSTSSVTQPDQSKTKSSRSCTNFTCCFAKSESHHKKKSKTLKKGTKNVKEEDSKLNPYSTSTHSTNNTDLRKSGFKNKSQESLQDGTTGNSRKSKKSKISTTLPKSKKLDSTPSQEYDNKKSVTKKNSNTSNISQKSGKSSKLFSSTFRRSGRPKSRSSSIKSQTSSRSVPSLTGTSPSGNAKGSSFYGGIHKSELKSKGKRSKNSTITKDGKKTKNSNSKTSKVSKISDESALPTCGKSITNKDIEPTPTIISEMTRQSKITPDTQHKQKLPTANNKNLSHEKNISNNLLEHNGKTQLGKSSDSGKVQSVGRKNTDTDMEKPERTLLKKKEKGYLADGNTVLSIILQEEETKNKRKTGEKHSIVKPQQQSLIGPRLSKTNKNENQKNSFQSYHNENYKKGEEDNNTKKFTEERKCGISKQFVGYEPNTEDVKNQSFIGTGTSTNNRNSYQKSALQQYTSENYKKEVESNTKNFMEGRKSRISIPNCEPEIENGKNKSYIGPGTSTNNKNSFQKSALQQYTSENYKKEEDSNTKNFMEGRKSRISIPGCEPETENVKNQFYDSTQMPPESTNNVETTNVKEIKATVHKSTIKNQPLYSIQTLQQSRKSLTKETTNVEKSATFPQKSIEETDFESKNNIEKSKRKSQSHLLNQSQQDLKKSLVNERETNGGSELLLQKNRTENPDLAEDIKSMGQRKSQTRQFQNTEKLNYGNKRNVEGEMTMVRENTREELTPRRKSAIFAPNQILMTEKERGGGSIAHLKQPKEEADGKNKKSYNEINNNPRRDASLTGGKKSLTGEKIQAKSTTEQNIGLGKTKQLSREESITKIENTIDNVPIEAQGSTVQKKMSRKHSIKGSVYLDSNANNNYKQSFSGEIPADQNHMDRGASKSIRKSIPKKKSINTSKIGNQSKIITQKQIDTKDTPQVKSVSAQQSKGQGNWNGETPVKVWGFDFSPFLIYCFRVAQFILGVSTHDKLIEVLGNFH